MSKGISYRYRDSWKNDYFKDRNQEKKERTRSEIEAMEDKRHNFTESNGEKSNIAITILKNFTI